MHVIKRYANRKLYDTHDRRYVTLAQIAERLRAGEDVQIVDNPTGKDITSVTLSQILAETGRKDAEALPKTFLTDIVRRGGGALSDALKKGSDALSQVMDLAEEQVERRIKALATAGEIPQREARRIIEYLRKGAAENRRALEARVEEGVKATLSRLDIPSKSDIDALAERLDRLHEALEKPAKRARRTGRPAAPRPRAARPRPTGSARPGRAARA
jgi:polyhydroxyalkanoate synthesis repressor PhaR